MKAILDISPVKGVVAQVGKSQGLLDAFLGAISVVRVDLVSMGLFPSSYLNRPKLMTSARLGKRPSGNVIGASLGNII